MTIDVNPVKPWLLYDILRNVHTDVWIMRTVCNLKATRPRQFCFSNKAKRHLATDPSNPNNRLKAAKHKLEQQNLKRKFEL